MQTHIGVRALTTSDYRKILPKSEVRPKSLRFSSEIRKISSFMPYEWGTSWKMRKLYKLGVQFSGQEIYHFQTSNMTSFMTACQVSTLCSSSANFEKSTSYNKRLKLVSKLGTAPLTAHNVSSSAEFIYVCTLCVGFWGRLNRHWYCNSIFFN